MENHSIKRTSLILLLLIILLCNANGQSVVFTDDPAYTSGHASTVLDVKSTSKGFLVPRMTLAQRPSSPATGLMIYQTDNTPGFYYYNGSGWALVGPSVDGSETKVSAGTNLSVTGSGTTGSPYVVNATAADGSETKIDAGTNVTLSGTGTSANHYIVNGPTADGSETKISAGTNVTVTGSGTSASHYIVNAAAGNGSETKIDAGTNVTVTGSGTSASHYVINSTGGNGAETIITAGTAITKSGTGTTGDPYILGYSTQSVTKAQRDVLGPYAGQIVACNNCGQYGELQVYNGTAWTNLTGASTLTVLAVGDSYKGGKIAYIFQSSDAGYVAGQVHGLIAANSNQSSGIVWSSATNNTGATATAIGSGNTNTNLIVGNEGAGTYAAKLCSDYSVTESGVIYDDWYLPSLNEMIAICSPSNLIGLTAGVQYWTSSESAFNQAYRVIPTGGTWVNVMKSSSLYVRPIRTF
jgi:hypothetical protein